MPIARLKFMLSVFIPYYLHQEHIMRKREGEVCDTTKHFSKIQVLNFLPTLVVLLSLVHRASMRNHSAMINMARWQVSR